MKIDPWPRLVLPTSLPLSQGSPALKGVSDKNIFLKISGFFCILEKVASVQWTSSWVHIGWGECGGIAVVDSGLAGAEPRNRVGAA